MKFLKRLFFCSGKPTRMAIRILSSKRATALILRLWAMDKRRRNKKQKYGLSKRKIDINDYKV